MSFAYFGTISLFVLIGLIDRQQHHIYHATTIPGILLAVAFSSRLPARSSAHAWVGTLIGMGLFAVIRFLAEQYYGKRALGFGDVMLAGLIGAVGGVVTGLLMLAAGMLAAGIFSAIQLQRHAAARLDMIPYGAFLCGGAIVVLVWELMQ